MTPEGPLAPLAKINNLGALKVNLERYLNPDEFYYVNDYESGIESEALVLEAKEASRLIGYIPLDGESHVLLLETKNLKSERNRIYIPLDSTPDPQTTDPRVNELNFVVELLREGVYLQKYKQTDQENILELYAAFLKKIGEIADINSIQIRKSDTLGQQIEVLYFPHMGAVQNEDSFDTETHTSRKDADNFLARGQSLLYAYREKKSELYRFKLITGTIDGIELTILPSQLKPSSELPKNEITRTFATSHPYWVYFRSLENTSNERVVDITEIQAKILSVFALKGLREIGLNSLKYWLEEYFGKLVQTKQISTALIDLTKQIENYCIWVSGEEELRQKKGREIVGYAIPLPAFSPPKSD